MAYFTGEIKNPFQDPIRKETEYKERKPLKESMIQRIAYFISSASKKMSFKEFVQNNYGKEIKEASLNEECKSSMLEDNHIREERHMNTGKDIHYFKVRDELLKQERNDKELFKLCECLPIKEDYNDTNGQEQYILEYTDKWQRPNQLAIDLKNGANKKKIQNYHKKNLKSRNKIVNQLLENLTQIQNPPSNLISHTSNTTKHKKSFMDFMHRQFKHEFKTISGRNYSKEKLNHTNTINICEIKQQPIVLPNIPLPIKKTSSKYNVNRTFDKERKLSHLFLKGVCRDGFLKQKYTQFMKQDTITPIKNNSISLRNNNMPSKSVSYF